MRVAEDEEPQRELASPGQPHTRGLPYRVRPLAPFNPDPAPRQLEPIVLQRDPQCRTQPTGTIRYVLPSLPVTSHDVAPRQRLESAQENRARRPIGITDDIGAG